MAAEFKEGTMNEDKQNYVRRVVERFPACQSVRKALARLLEYQKVRLFIPM
jgi:hypothetical protein